MKLNLSATVSAVVFATIVTAPVMAAPATRITIGQHPATDCAQAADAQSRGRLLDSGRHDALAACSEALDGTLSAGNRTATLANRGILEAAGDRTSAAIADFDAALARNPGLTDVYINRGAALLRASRYTEARADFDHAISLHASNATIAYFDRGMANEKSGDIQAAYRDYKMALTLSPNFEPAKTELSRFHLSDRVATNR